jgi:fructokinase
MGIDILFLGGTSVDLIQDKACPEKFLASVGGSVTNSAIIASTLGLKTAMLSRVGDDPFGNFAVKFLDSRNVNTSAVIRDPDIKTSLAIAAIDRYGNSKYTFYKNAPKDSVVPFNTSPKNLLNSCGIFHFGSGFSYQKETFEESLKYIRHLKRRGVFISFDPNIRPYAVKDKKEVKNRVLKLLKLVGMAKLSLYDLVFLTGSKSPEKGLKSLQKRFKCRFILTLGSRGAVYPGLEQKFIKIPAFKVKIADTIGAGDAFTAGLLYKIAVSGESKAFKDIRPNLAFASSVSAIICTAHGSHQALKNMEQIKSFLKLNYMV